MRFELWREEEEREGFRLDGVLGFAGQVVALWVELGIGGVCGLGRWLWPEFVGGGVGGGVAVVYVLRVLVGVSGGGGGGGRVVVPNKRIESSSNIHAPPSSAPINGVISSDHTLDTSRNFWFRLFLPANFPATTYLPLIIYFHGGGFVSFSPATVPFKTLCRKLAGDLAAAVISVNYRLSPEHRFPAPYDDGFDILKYLDDGGLPVNVDLGRCFIAGDSASGNVAHHLAVKASGTRFKTVRIRGLITIQPFFGGEERMESELRFGNGPLLTLDKTDFYWKAFLPDGSNRDHPGSNVFGPGSESVSGLDPYPPTLLVVGGLDLLQDWQRRYCDGLRRSGKVVELVEFSNVGHGFYSTPELPEYDLLVAKVKEFVQKQLQLDN